MATCIICGRDAGFFSEVCDICKEKRSPGSSGKPLTTRHVSSLALFQEAAFVIYRNRSVLFLAVILPIICSSAIRITCIAYVCSAENNPSVAAVYLFSFAQVPFYVMFATICHRIVLLGDASLASRWGLFWSVRETRFLGWLLILGVITLAVSTPIWILIWQLPFWALDWLIEWLPFSISFYACVLVSTYIDGRFGLIMPATAIGNRLNPLRSWRFTAGNGWSIFVALSIPILITEAIDYLLFDLLLDTDSMAVNFLRGLLYYPLVAIGVVVITIAYRDLVLRRDRDATARPL
jgi:hypothetical protein